MNNTWTEESLDDVTALIRNVNAVGRKVLSENYFEFFKEAWAEVLEPDTKLDDNWHIKYLCDVAQAEIERIARHDPKTTDVVINVPPRSLKTHIWTICLCPWAWTRFPHMRMINLSYTEKLSTPHCMESRRLIESAWYQSMWGDVFMLTTDQNQKSYFENDKRGFRRSCAAKSVTGTGADVMVWDDPQSPEMAGSEIERETTKRVYSQTGFSRLNNQRVGLRVIVQQRLHEDDLTGYLMSRNPDQYRHFCFPTELCESVSPDEVRDRYQDGLFFPRRFGWDYIESAKLATGLGAQGYAAQCMQNPSPAEGGTFKRTWWRFWTPPGMVLTPPAYKDERGEPRTSVQIELPAEMERIIDSWDTAVEGGEKNDYYAGGMWGKAGANKFLLNQVRRKVDYPTAKKLVADLYFSNPQTSALLIEKASNGPAIKADLMADIPGILTIPTGRRSKEDRVRMADTVPYSAQVEGGNVYLPHPATAPWVDEFIEEHAKFPKGKNDDQVDQSSQAVNYLTTAKYVWPQYSPGVTEHHRKFGLAWRSYFNYAGMYVDDNLTISVVAAAWDVELKKLFVYGCIQGERMSLKHLASKLVVGMKVGVRKIHGVYANREVFGPKGLATAINAEVRSACKGAGLKANLSVIEPIEYDRLGAIGVAATMFAKSEIVVHTICQEASRQLAGWTIDGGQPAEGFGMCNALTLIVNEVHRTVRKVNKPQYIDSYRPVVKKLTPQERAAKSGAGWQGQ